MREHSIKTMLLTGALLISCCEDTLGWSSLASRTENDLRSLNGAIEVYRAEFGRLPSPQQYLVELQNAGIWTASQTGIPSDRWGRPFVYRVPGKHGEFDLYSLGADGIDQDGALDDISNWAGVNDGFHWKTTWPAGRFTIATGIALGIGMLLLGRFFRLRIILPLSGGVVCLGVFIGCQLLMHPGIVPSRNQPLGAFSAVALCLFASFAIVFTTNLRKPEEPTPSPLRGNAC